MSNMPLSTLAAEAVVPDNDLDLVADGLLTVKEAIAFISLSRSTLHKLMENGQLGYVKIGKARRIPRKALLELAAKAVVRRSFSG